MKTAMPANSYKNHRFPAEIISHAVWLYFRFCLSYRDVEELLFACGVTVTYEAILKWCRKFGQSYANELRQRRPRPGDKWHLEVCQTQPIKMGSALHVMLAKRCRATVDQKRFVRERRSTASDGHQRGVSTVSVIQI
jgi:transposase-like protein